MARSQNMAVIDLALASQQPHNDPAGGATPMPPDLLSMPSMTADQKRAYDAARQTRLDQQALLEKQLADEEAEQNALVDTAKATADAASRIVRNAGVRIAGLPTPGSIILPLLVLLIFFMLLLPINGHTRLVWLWLVISGNAIVGPDNGTGPEGPGGLTPDTPEISISGVQPLIFMTGVEDVQ